MRATTTLENLIDQVESKSRGNFDKTISLDKMEFATPQDRETQEKVWKRIVGKSFMSKREAFALMGFLRKLL